MQFERNDRNTDSTPSLNQFVLNLQHSTPLNYTLICNTLENEFAEIIFVEFNYEPCIFPYSKVFNMKTWTFIGLSYCSIQMRKVVPLPWLCQLLSACVLPLLQPLKSLVKCQLKFHQGCISFPLLHPKFFLLDSVSISSQFPGHDCEISGLLLIFLSPEGKTLTWCLKNLWQHCGTVTHARKLGKVQGVWDPRNSGTHLRRWVPPFSFLDSLPGTRATLPISFIYLITELSMLTKYLRV